MALNVLTISPSFNDIDVPVDTSIVMEFDNDLDPFTVVNGIVLYIKTENLYSGPDLAQLDTEFSDVLDVQEENAYYPLKYQVNGKFLTISPITSLFPDKEHYISIYPGNDAQRYLSQKTVGEVLVVGNSTSANVEIRSSYTGKTDDVFEIVFTSNELISVSKGIRPVGDFPFVNGEDINIGELTFSLTGVAWEALDSITIPVFKAVGVTDMYLNSWTTSKYKIITPGSNKIQFVDDILDPIRIIKTIPDDNSINNKTVNPIIITFNKDIKADQSLINKVKIKRTSFDTGIQKNVAQYYKVEGNKLKIYMISTTR